MSVDDNAFLGYSFVELEKYFIVMKEIKRYKISVSNINNILPVAHFIFYSNNISNVTISKLKI
jgi:hypothetical protein